MSAFSPAKSRSVTKGHTKRRPQLNPHLEALEARALLTNLTGLLSFSTDSGGSETGGQVWDTVPGAGGFYDLFVAPGTPNGNPDGLTSPFINGPSDAQASINIPLQPGENMFTIFGEPGLSTGYEGLNLFFGGSNLPSISAFAPTRADSTVPPFSPDSGRTIALNDGTRVPGAGTVTFNDGGTPITLTDFFWADPYVYGVDRVEAYDANPDGYPDFVGSFTLMVGNYPDLVATSLTWNTSQGGVDLGYQVNYAALPQDTSAGFYWASGTTEDTILEPAATPIPIPSTTPVGQPQTMHVDQQDLQSAPPDAKYLLAELDPNNAIAESDKTNNIASVAYSPATINSITNVLPNPRTTPVSVVDVTFSEPISIDDLSSSALTLTLDGATIATTDQLGLMLISGDISGYTYAIMNLPALTAQQGKYMLSVNAGVMHDQDGDPGVGSMSTSWLMDTTPPASQVSPLPERGTSLSFTVSVTGIDPAGPEGSPPSGVASFAVYVSTNGRPWTLWQTLTPAVGTLPLKTASATFDGQSNMTYAFYSVATDKAGNTEVKKPVIEASTYLPDLTPPVTSVDGTTGPNPSLVNPSTGMFTLSITGADAGGSGLTYFKIFVAVDAGVYSQVGAAIPAGPPDSQGNVHATIPYQGLTDGTQHTYSFFSIGLDGAGNIQTPPATSNLRLTETFALPSALQMTSLVVEHGAIERSYIRYLDVVFNESDRQSGGALTQIVASVGTSNPDIELYKYDLNGDASSKSSVSLAGVSACSDRPCDRARFWPERRGRQREHDRWRRLLRARCVFAEWAGSRALFLPPARRCDWRRHCG